MYKQPHILKKTSAVEKVIRSKLTSLPNPKNPTGMEKSTSPTSRVELQKFRRLEAGKHVSMTRLRVSGETKPLQRKTGCKVAVSRQVRSSG